eukprot:scaffold9903_cov30-Tisochrysis_lutea.AAC.2
MQPSSPPSTTSARCFRSSRSPTTCWPAGVGVGRSREEVRRGDQKVLTPESGRVPDPCTERRVHQGTPWRRRVIYVALRLTRKGRHSTGERI